MWSVSISGREPHWLSSIWHSCDCRNRIFHLVPRSWSCLVSSYWQLAGRTSMTCLLEQGRRRHLGSRREAFFNVHECPVEATKVSEYAAPAADSENQVPSQKPGSCLRCCSAPCTAAGTGHLPSHFPNHPVDQSPVSHPSISDFPIPSVLPIACCACSFPFYLCNPGSSVWCVGCSLTFWHCIVYHNTAEEGDFSLPWDGCIT